MRVFCLPLNVAVSFLCLLRRVIGSTLPTGGRSPFLMSITSWLLGFLLDVSLGSYILLLLMTRRVGSRGGTLAKTLLFCGMLSIMLLFLDKPLPSFLSIKVDNWQPRINAVEKVLSSWRQRSLSFRGKALVINALALSRVWYVASDPHA